MLKQYYQRDGKTYLQVLEFANTRRTVENEDGKPVRKSVSVLVSAAFAISPEIKAGMTEDSLQGIKLPEGVKLLDEAEGAKAMAEEKDQANKAVAVAFAKANEDSQKSFEARTAAG